VACYAERARANALRRYRPADDPEVISARQKLAAAHLGDVIRRVVAEAPPLSDEQRVRLALLLGRDSGGPDATK
jgi:hypothetical protein